MVMEEPLLMALDVPTLDPRNGDFEKAASATTAKSATTTTATVEKLFIVWVFYL